MNPVTICGILEPIGMILRLDIQYEQLLGHATYSNKEEEISNTLQSPVYNTAAGQTMRTAPKP